MLLQLVLPLSALACSAMAQSTVGTTPKEYPRETGRPKNMMHCRINANSVLPWVVGVWSIPFLQFIGHGSMITYISFISSCKPYHGRQPNHFKAVGQYIWNVSHAQEPCMQEKLISAIHRHPNCIKSSQHATFFDYAVFRMIYPFDITGPNFPTISFKNTPYELMTGIKYINIIPNTTGCILPHFRNQNERPPVFDFESFVEAIPFHTQCVALLCEQLPPNDTFTSMCVKRIGERAKATMLCMKNKNRQHVVLGSNHWYWYSGTPLVCNGTAYGMATQLKGRARYPFPRWDDIHFVVTILRVWPWLIGRIKENSAPWVKHIYIEDMKLKPVKIRAAASELSSQSLKNLIAPIILLHVYFQAAHRPFSF